MQTISTDVLVIGGGATGTGCALDLAMRGIRCVLVEKGDLTHGTTGRYHGLLHSGGRYVTKDPQSARECAQENAILRRIMPHCIEQTSGFFVITPWDDESYGDVFVANCHRTGVPVQEISVAEMLRREPLLNPRISRVFEVPDASADSFLATHSVALAAREYGADIRTYHNVIELIRVGDRVVGAVVEDLRSGERIRIDCAYVLNAAGAWAGKIAALAGVTVTVVPGKGTMVAMNHRMVNTVVNRCKLPSDGDIIVPIHTVAVIGTTDVHVPDPDVFGIEPEEIQFMLDEGEKLVPGFRQYRALRAWAGVRPLYKDKDVASDRDIPRTFKLLDHEERDGVSGIFSIVGGKWTTYRLMAEQTVNEIARRLGNTQPCRTASEVLPIPKFEHTRHATVTVSPDPAAQTPHYWLGKPLALVESQHAAGDLICECELVTRDRIQAAIDAGAHNLDDIRRDVRMGMGPCQGGWCIYRTANILYERRCADGLSHVHTNEAILHFLQERWKGLTPVLWGDQLRQARLDELIYYGVLGIQRLRALAEPGGGLVTQHPAIATEYVQA
ncbi:MAG: anaerobic glycerol-3-phosphate dehydrogenase subunit A [Chloroflexus sp.]|jgi:glycerol-3-phosphate dehydrogenase|uniref:anaerobic glycerol-3-phosphate dehydrogenase subunit GlpA n=1 Tax=unclassified Chloroflexus TaxID=2633855 RepID=UPI0004DF2365|nr:anaerobic glycerol-3-phosphate dehydrogenase subunit A [Chloroflexus sp.]MBO9338160.1 anaerobic glycerol-3-phosphate dehydrogenase subunit A [Chloroflexus sp.]MBO9346859.1 anaerobic glycerol-3-phosphate dehydrogenase subunit A [Chloroflexus sp.]MBO9372816.1 anaerobic glycerol-3-phosphate dehydrogenase subunit A [Chloroflexus sp.]